MRLSIAEQVFGHNKAPLDEVLANDFADLEKDVQEMAARLKAAPQSIKTEEQLAEVGRVVIDAKALLKRVEETRKGETDPLYNMQKAIKANFDDMAAPISRLVNAMQGAADEYSRRKAAEEQRRRDEERRRAEEQAQRERQKADEAKTVDGAVAAAGRAEVLEQKAAEMSGSVTAADAVRTRVAGGGVVTASQQYDFEIEDYNAIDLNLLRPYLKREDVEKAIRSAVRAQKQHTNIPGVRVFEGVKARFR